MAKKFEDVVYHELHDQTLKDFLMGMFATELKKTHYVTSIIYMPKENKWIIKLEKDHIKAMQDE